MFMKGDPVVQLLVDEIYRCHNCGHHVDLHEGTDLKCLYGPGKFYSPYKDALVQRDKMNKIQAVIDAGKIKP